MLGTFNSEVEKLKIQSRKKVFLPLLTCNKHTTLDNICIRYVTIFLVLIKIQE